MKVWVNYRDDGGYSGGMILVAANSAEEAHTVFHADERLGYMWTYWSWEDPPYISDEYYKPDGWKLMPLLEANVDKPQVLAQAGYTE